jgi:hypothetical protein
MPTESEGKPSKLRLVFSRDQLDGPLLETKATIREDPLARHATVPRGDAPRAPTAEFLSRPSRLSEDFLQP